MKEGCDDQDSDDANLMQTKSKIRKGFNVQRSSQELGKFNKDARSKISSHVVKNLRDRLLRRMQQAESLATALQEMESNGAGLSTPPMTLTSRCRPVSMSRRSCFCTAMRTPPPALQRLLLRPLCLHYSGPYKHSAKLNSPPAPHHYQHLCQHRKLPEG